MLGNDVAADALDALYTESGGNPFYLLELARDQRTPGGHGGWHNSGVAWYRTGCWCRARLHSGSASATRWSVAPSTTPGGPVDGS